MRVELAIEQLREPENLRHMACSIWLLVRSNAADDTTGPNYRDKRKNGGVNAYVVPCTQSLVD